MAFQKPARLRIWGRRDGERVTVEQNGFELRMEPEIAEIRLSDDVALAAGVYLDEVIEWWGYHHWVDDWRTDAELQAEADRRNAERAVDGPWDVAQLRAEAERSYLRHFQSPPENWETIERFLANPAARLANHPEPRDFQLCRECYERCEWVWFHEIVGPSCGAAGWVAICRGCRTWHRERRAISY